MSMKHPIIAVTGSSGAGTTTVKHTFEAIFHRENVNAAIVEGDSFHRYTRAEMKTLIEDAEREGQRGISHFGPEANLLRRPREPVPRLRRRPAPAAAATTCTTKPKRLRPQAAAGHLHRMGGHAGRHRLPVLRGPARRAEDRQVDVAPPRRPADRRGADHQPRMDAEAAPRHQHPRLHRRGGAGHHPAPHARLRALHRPPVRAPTSTSSACRWWTPPTPSSRATSRPRTSPWW
jgi:hypothetical protein